MPAFAADSARSSGDERGHCPLWRVKRFAALAIANADDRQVGRQDECRKTGVESLGNDLVADSAILEDVDLEPTRRSRRRRRDLGGRRRRHGREAHERPSGRGTARGAELVLLVRDLLIGHRGDKHGHRDRRAEHDRLRRDVGDVDEHAITEPAPRERFAVPAHRPLVAGASGDIPPGVGWNDLRGEALGIVDREELLHERGA